MKIRIIMESATAEIEIDGDQFAGMTKQEVEERINQDLLAYVDEETEDLICDQDGWKAVEIL